MHKQATIKEFYSILHKGKHKEAISLFAADASVYTPEQGKQAIKRFLSGLGKKATKMRFVIRDLYFSAENPNRAIAHIDFYSTPKSGAECALECIDIFEFIPNSDKIKSLTNIYNVCSVKKKTKKKSAKKSPKKRAKKKKT